MQHSKVIGPANLMENFADHRLVSWKGTKPKQMLHLSDALKLKMGKSIVTYFKVIYRMTEDSFRSKNEALAHSSTKANQDLMSPATKVQFRFKVYLINYINIINW